MSSNIIGYGGGKGGGGGGYHTASEASDSLHSTAYAKVLDLISEGEIEGPVNGLQSVFFNQTPLQNADGSMNFSGVTIDFRSGTQVQDYIAGFPSVENELSIGLELKAATPWVRAVNNLQLSAVRLRLAVAALSRADAGSGDINGHRVDYAIELATDQGAFQQILRAAFDGKTTTKYERSHRIDLPPATIGWTVRVRRLTPHANSAIVQDSISISAITEVIDAKLRYPMSALVGVQVDAAQFQNIPVRSYHMRGRIIKVPSNYDPISRRYTGVWDGTFKPAWSNNPAWVFYDIVLNARYGLCHLLHAAQIDKWSLYQIAQYCDVLVADGHGGTEPRFTCNVYLQARTAAYKVLQDLAAIFRGISYWAGGSIISSADMPSDPVYVYTAANVIDGKFQRVGSSKKTRYTVGLVSWNDPADFYRAKVEYVEDRDGIARYGVQQLEISLLGCTSQGQAQRAGNWALLSSRLETSIIHFSVGLDGAVAAPGQIIRVADPHRMGRRNAGRIRAAQDRVVTVDKACVMHVGDRLTVILPTAIAETRSIVNIDGDRVTVSAPWSTLPLAQSVWSVDSIDLAAPLFKVISVTEKDGLIFDLTATQHEPGKFAYIDHGTRIERPPEALIPPSAQPRPTQVSIAAHEVIDQGIVTSNMTISWNAAPHAIAYLAEWRKDDGNWRGLPRTGQCSIEVNAIYAGRYSARVRAINPLDVTSLPAYAADTVLSGKTSAPPRVTSLLATSLVFGIGLSWGFPAYGASDTQHTEIWYSQSPEHASAIKLGDYAYPHNTHLMMGLASGSNLFFWARLVDRSGNQGAFYPDGAGVNGQVSSDASTILDALAGQIGKDQLTQELIRPLQQIDQLEDQLNARLADLPDAATIEQTIARQSNTDQDATAATQLMALINADASDARVRTALQSTFGQAQAQIIKESQTRASEQAAMAESIAKVQANLGDNIGVAVKQVSKVVADLKGQLSASWSVKTDVTADGKHYMAGIGTGVEKTANGMQSHVYALADRFAILNLKNGKTITPFVVQNGATYINNAIIGDATITSGKFKDWLESTATNKHSNVPVLRINFRTGEIQQNGGSSGGRITSNFQAIKIIDDKNTVRVQIGNLTA